MLKKTVEYTNFNGQKRSQDLYFNMNKFELTQMMIGADNVPFQEYMQRLLDTQDVSEMLTVVKDILLMAYGVKSTDGEHFVKSADIRHEFETSASFPELYYQLMSHPDELLKFVWGIMPPDLRPDESSLTDILASFNDQTETVDVENQFRIVTDVTDKS